MSERKVRLDSERLYKNRANQGIDEMIFELSLTGKDMHDLQKIYLYNKQGFIYGSVEAHKGKATLNLNLPRYVRGDNMQPFSLSETIRLEIIKNDCEEALKTIFRDSITAQISKIEVNITQPICGRATQGEVLNLLSHATMSHKHDNIKYVGRSKKDKKRLKEEFHTVITRREKYWIGKFYDKSEQLIKERLERQLPTDDIPKDLLRIEIIFVDRTLTKLFGDKKTLSDVLKTQYIIDKERIMHKKLTAYLSTLEADGFGKWIVDTESRDTVDNPIQMPYVSYSRMVKQFVNDVYAFADEHQEYDLYRYNIILAENGIEWDRKSMCEKDVSTLGGKCILALIMGAVRAERFVDGALLNFFRTGTITKWLRRLQEIDET